MLYVAFEGMQGSSILPLLPPLHEKKRTKSTEGKTNLILHKILWRNCFEFSVYLLVKSISLEFICLVGWFLNILVNN